MARQIDDTKDDSKVSVTSIIVDRLLEKIEKGDRLPWQKPFTSPCINWFSSREYSGINRFLLDGGEYLTVNQLKEYNKKFDKEDSFWFEKGTPQNYVVFYKKYERKLTKAEVEEIETKGFDSKSLGKVFKKDGLWHRRTFVLRYTTVINIDFIKNKKGEKLEPKLGKTIHMVHTPAETIIKDYLDRTGVKISHAGGGAAYIDLLDSVTIDKPEYFVNSETYYRVLFHELVHSTGIPRRLNRDCFVKYHNKKTERSKEELIAEMGSLLLGTEAGFRSEGEWVDNSDSYILGWATWIKNNKGDIVSAMSQAEKAVAYILEGEITTNLEDSKEITS